MELFKLLGTIAIDNSGANEAIDATTGKAEKSESKMTAAFKKIGTAVVAAFAVDKIVDFGKVCVETAATVKAMNSQFEQTFGDMQNEAAAAIDKVAASSNILNTRLKGVGTSIYAFAKTTGMESVDALGLMERALQVTADSAAYYDRSLDETSESLKSFLKGNFENDAALGLSCTETTRNAAANKLYGKSFKDLSEAQKQLTLLQMVEDANALSGAMGQAAREGTGWENVTGNLKEAWSQFKAVIGMPVLNAIVPVIQKITSGVSALGEKVGGFIELMGDAEARSNLFKDILNKVFGEETTTSILTLFETISQYALPFFEQMQTRFQLLWDVCSTVWTTIGQPIWDMISYAVGELARLFSENMPSILAFFQTAMTEMQNAWNNYLKPALEEIGAFLNDYVKPAFEFVFSEIIAPLIETVFTTIAFLWSEVLKPAFSAIADFLNNTLKPTFEYVFTTVIQPMMEKVFGRISALWNFVLKPVFAAIADYLENHVKPVFEWVFQNIIQPIVENTFGAISNLWNNTLKPVFTGICEFLNGVFTDNWDKAFGGILGIVTGQLNAMVTAVQTPINTLRDIIDNAVEFIKEKFDFEWKLPDLKLPHFTIDGSFSINPPSVPSFGIDWYAKGGIMNDPTAFGINPANGNLMVGGEAGAEAIAPIDTLQKYIREAVSVNDAAVANAVNEGFAKLMAFLVHYIPQLSNMQIVMDNGALVGELAPGIDDYLGRSQDAKERMAW